MTPEELKAKGIEDFQLWYAIGTVRRTMGPALAPAKASK
jgi:carboxyl-terminal processing protease